uniref:Large ribosomal subunit protein uL4 C-terminal domain-containing protein n=1 Tax=Ciona savignyi TaxID=51511 RepID=H2YDJ0_CIOSA
ACARPLVSVYSDKGAASGNTITLPAVFKAPIRPDIVNFVHTNISKNHRQPYAVNRFAGEQTSAESWGTGRAVARIPRGVVVPIARDKQRSVNMCRGGRMYAPTKTWRRWHRRCNINQRRFAVCSALAASALPALVMSKGKCHKIDQTPEIPLVVEDKVQQFKKTKEAVVLLKKLKAWDDIKKVMKSRRIRAGKGKLRNRRHTMKRGPCVIYDQDEGITKAFRNIPGITLISVDRLNLLKIAPGGHVGRFLIWTESALKRLDAIYGTWKKPSSEKTGYNLPMPKMTCTDLSKILQSSEVKSALRAPKGIARSSQKKNPLKNIRAMLKLNPAAASAKRSAILTQQRRIKEKAEKRAK